MHVLVVVGCCVPGVLVGWLYYRLRRGTDREWDSRGSVELENDIARRTRAEWALGRRRRSGGSG